MHRLCLPLFIACLLGSVATANEQYRQGDAFGRAAKSQEQAAISGFNPGQSLPGYTSAPPEASLYGGTEATATDLSAQGSQALSQSEAGKAITTSILAMPADNKPSLDAPFIVAGTDAQATADKVTDGSFNGCTAQAVSHTEFTNHVCSRDTRVDQHCLNKASITGQWQERWVEVTTTVSRPVPAANVILKTYCASGCGGDHTERTGYHIEFTAKPPVSEHILSTTLTLTGTHYPVAWTMQFNYRSNLGVTTAGGAPVALWGNLAMTPADTLRGVARGRDKDMQFAFRDFSAGKATLTLTYQHKKMVKERYYAPALAWSESCPFNKAEGALTGTQCVEAGGVRTIYVEGKPYSLYSDCWAYRSSYLTQSQSQGTCSQYSNDPACTVANRQCAYQLDGFCLHENLTYSCERRSAGTGMLCGGTFFCKDGACAQSAAGKSNAFQKAASQLAAVAAAGKDVAALNSTNVRAFTGKAQFCKKFAAGFSNCCKDSGWGQDVGLASCSSEEKALGEARTRKLTVDVGEFCSKKVLGVCVEKKRGYCVFDSKLAQIVQQQGRQWQLGIHFGGASSPDCRGITIAELQAIKFDNLDFSNFYEELTKGARIPQDNALLQRAQQQIAQQVAAQKDKP